MSAPRLAHYAVLLTLASLLPSCGFMSGYIGGPSTGMATLEHRYEVRAARGMARFVFDDLGGLSTDALQTNAVPWKVVAAALVLQRADDPGTSLDQQAVARELERFGFVFGATFDNWSFAAPRPSSDKPLGIVTGKLTRSFPEVDVEVANLTCAACHAGVIYDRYGAPRRQVWLGLPNTSINLEAYSQAVYRGLKKGMRSPERLLATIRRVFSDVSATEMRTLERYVLPALDRRLAEVERTTDAPAPFSNGGPGLTNGIGALKRQLGLLPPGTFSREAPLVSIPDLGGVLLRSSFLADGIYGVPEHPRFERVTLEDVSPERAARAARVISFFIVPAMGVEPRRASRAVPRVEEIVAFLQTYQPPRFPGEIDLPLAQRGRAVYDARCAGCHGAYSADPVQPALLAFPNRLSEPREIATDPERWRAVTPDLARAVAASPFGKHIAVATKGGYVAPRLGGLWATAPYLHNGSVPTLWHLMHPEERPIRFYVGGHRLDFTKVGIAGFVDETGTYRYPEGYRSWSDPALYDTTQPGRSNRGHEAEFDGLIEVDKAALLEFLKLV